MTTCAGIKRGYPHQPVNSDFRLGIAVGVFTPEGPGYALNAGLVTRR